MNLTRRTFFKLLGLLAVTRKMPNVEPLPVPERGVIKGVTFKDYGADPLGKRGYVSWKIMEASVIIKGGSSIINGRKQ